MGVSSSAQAVAGAGCTQDQGPGMVPVPVIGVLVNLDVSPWIGIDCMGADEMGAGDHVPEVTVDRIDEEKLAERVPIVAPGVGRAVGQGLDTFAARIVTPDS